MAWLAALALGVVASNVDARPYTLEWDPNEDEITAGYRVYIGTASGVYVPADGVDVDNATKFQVDLVPGVAYYFAVRAYSFDDVLGPPSAELRFSVPAVRISSSVPSPQATGTPIIINATGLPDTFEYQFITRNPGGVWSVVQAYSTATSWSWDTTAAPVGAYVVQVRARPLGATFPYDTVATLVFQLVTLPPVTAVAVTSNVASPQFTGAPVTFTATATGTTANYEYQFVVRNPAGAWSIARPYGPAPSWTWNAGPVGPYFLQVWARNVGSPIAFEAFAGKPFFVLPVPTSPVTAVALMTEHESPQPLGTEITVTATATGTSGIYQYLFALRDPAGVWTIVRPYSSVPYWSWDTGAGPAGNYFILVLARNAGSNTPYEALNSLSFQLVPPP